MLPCTKLRPEEITQEGVRIQDRFGLRTPSLWRIGLSYSLVCWALLLWASLAPGSFWFNRTAQASPASQIMVDCAILTAFFIPFVIYFPATQKEGDLNSFNSMLSSFKTIRGYLKQVVVCSLFTLIPLFSVYVMFALMSWVGLITNDLIIPIILGRSFLIFVVSLTLVSTTTAVGLAMSGSRALNNVATAIAASTVLLPFLLSKGVTGSTFEDHLVRWVQGLKTSTAISGFPLLIAMLIGSFFTWRYRPKEPNHEQGATGSVAL